MAKFQIKKTLEQLEEDLKKPNTDGETILKQFRMKVFKGYELDKPENIKKSPAKTIMAKARKIAKELKIEGHEEHLRSFWNVRAMRNEEDEWKPEQEMLAILEDEMVKLGIKPESNSEQEEGQSITTADVPTLNKPISHYVTGEELDMVNQSLQWSGMSEEDFIRKALVSYAKNFRPHTMVNTEEMTNEELRKSKKAGTAEELIKRAIDAIIEWNESQPEIKNRYQITVNSVKRLAGSRASIIKKVLDEQAEKIHTHHEHKVSHDPLWNRGKPEISEKIGGFSF